MGSLRINVRNVPELLNFSGFAFSTTVHSTWERPRTKDVVPVLLRLYELFGENFLLEAALRHGDLLLQSANRGADGLSWKTIPEPGMQDLTGFSHGTAGIAWSLLEIYSKVKEERFLHAADEALRYERRWYDPKQENWPDFRSRTETGSTVCAMAWCHGALGLDFPASAHGGLRRICSAEKRRKLQFGPRQGRLSTRPLCKAIFRCAMGISAMRNC